MGRVREVCIVLAVAACLIVPYVGAKRAFPDLVAQMDPIKPNFNPFVLRTELPPGLERDPSDPRARR